MTFRKEGRPTWYTWPTLHGFGRYAAPWSTGARDKRTADRVEAYLLECAFTRPALVKGLWDKQYSLAQLWTANLQGRTDDLIRYAVDPLLHERIEAFRPTVSDKRVRDGLDQLKALTLPSTRLAFLTRLPDPKEPGGETAAKNIAGLIARRREAGDKLNTIGRGLFEAIRKLLLHELGEAGRDAVMAGVKRPYEDDQRDISLSPKQLSTLLERCSERLYPLVVTAALTGIDRGPLDRARVKHFSERGGVGRLEVQDRKTRARYATQQLPDVVTAIIRTLIAGKGQEDYIFNLRYNAVQSEWELARFRAGLKWLRFKDLRHVAGTAAAQHMNITEVMRFMRHTKSATTQRYLGSRPAEQHATLNKMAEDLGLDKAHLRKRRGA